MKNKKIAVLALVLSLTMLCGCARIEIVEEINEKGIVDTILNYLYPTRYVHNPQGVCFEDIEYVRPDLDELIKEAGAVLDALYEGRGYFRVTKLLDAAYDDYYNFMTMLAVANIRSLHDLTDEYYAQEYLWCSESASRVSQLFDEIYYACVDSRISDELEAFYFWDGFCADYSDREKSIYSDESVALMQEENALISEYRSIVSDTTVEWNGVEQSYDELFDTVEDERKAELIYSYYEKYSELLGELYIKLVDVRQRMAKSMGYESYEELQYETAYYRDFTPSEADSYIEAIKRYMVPLYIELEENGEYDAEWDNSYFSANLERDIEKIIGGIGGTADEAMELMLKYNLCDLEDNEHKAGMSFETYLENYSVPFLFIDPSGTVDDIMATIHELGHYTDDYMNYNASKSLELSESFSMGLEYLSLDYLSRALDSETAKMLRNESLLDAVSAFVIQASYAEFEALVYSTDADELTVEMLKDYALQCARDFGYCTEELENYYSMAWIDIAHFFEAPLYVITYPISNDIALQFYALEQKTPGAGVELYYSVMPAENYELLETIENTALESPFEVGELSKTAAFLRNELGY